jgi:predicted  nucleic acid-binding Zn-ribbon protein
MSRVDAEANVLSEDKDRMDDISIDNVKLVPVAESIRYRKRAQIAEQKAEQLSEQLNAVRQEAQELTEKMEQLKSEQSLTRKLVTAGASDLETALLVAKARAAKDGRDVDSLVEQLKIEKPHLFGSTKDDETGAAAPRTAVVKDRLTSGKSNLVKAASKAATTGSRVDLHEYLRLRRNFV